MYFHFLLQVTMADMNLHPWNVATLEEFLYYCCPECDLKVKDPDFFYAHAVQNHDKAQRALTQNDPDDTDTKFETNTDIKQEIEDMDYDDPDYDIGNIKSEDPDYFDPPEVELKEPKFEKRARKVKAEHDMWQCYFCGLTNKLKDDILAHVKHEHNYETVTRWMYGEPREHQCEECKLMFR